MSEFIFLSDNFGQDIVKSTIALFVVLDPLGIIPLYASITQKLEKAQRTTISKTVIITASLLLFAFAVAGNQIFVIFGISITSFMIAGGILLFIVATELLTHGSWRYDNSDMATEGGVVPIAGRTWSNNYGNNLLSNDRACSDYSVYSDNNRHYLRYFAEFK